MSVDERTGIGCTCTSACGYWVALVVETLQGRLNIPLRVVMCDAIIGC